MSFAQTPAPKEEKEDRIDQSAFPVSALNSLYQVAGTSRVKFYMEVDGGRTSYEGKFKKNGKKYSMEYSSHGDLEDIEVQVKRKKMDERLWATLENSLDSMSQRWKVEKIQYQYLPIHQQQEQIYDNLKTTRFQNIEMIVAFKNKRKIYRKELLFNAHGVLVNNREIKRNAYDFLLF